LTPGGFRFNGTASSGPDKRWPILHSSFAILARLCEIFQRRQTSQVTGELNFGDGEKFLDNSNPAGQIDGAGSAESENLAASLAFAPPGAENVTVRGWPERCGEVVRRRKGLPLPFRTRLPAAWQHLRRFGHETAATRVGITSIAWPDQPRQQREKTP
jgi:hypothetical protein